MNTNTPSKIGFTKWSRNVAVALLILPVIFLAGERLHGEDFDWRDIAGMNFLTPVKYQDHTGMCWAFSTVAGLESMYKITRNDPVYDPDLSEQQLACAGVGDAFIGGAPINALDYFKKVGIVTEEELPFTQSNNSPLWPLSPGWRERVYKINSYTGLQGAASAIKNSLKLYGPMITMMRVDDDWYGPEHGAYRGKHVVLITGYHDDSDLPGGGYFVIKNSWGEQWGDQGYGKILYSTFGTYAQYMISSPAYVTGPAKTLTFDTSTSPGHQPGSGTWSTNTDTWTTDGVSLNAWQNGEDAAVFASGGGVYVINVADNISAHAITFQNGAAGYTLSGGSLTVTHGGITSEENVLIQSDLTVGAPQQWSVAAGKTLTIGGAIDLHISPLTISGPGDTLIQGAIRDVRADARFDGLLGAFAGSLLKSGPGTLCLTAANTYTGDTRVSEGTLALSGAGGVIISSTVYVDGGRLLLDNFLDNHLHRLASSAGVTLQGGELALQGNSAGTGETIDNLVLGSGSSTITVVAADQVSSLTAPRLNRNNQATALVRGTLLGGGSSGAIGQIRFTAAPTLSNNGSGDQVGIVPYLIGDSISNGNGNDLVTYDNSGLRPLAGNQYASTLLENRNVKLTASPAAINSLAIRALVLSGNGSPVQVTVNNGSTLCLGSGALLSAGGAANSLAGGSITFGNNSATGYEGIVHTVKDLTIQSVIADNGSNTVGLTKGGAGRLTLIGENTYTGQTVVAAGTLQIGDGATNGSINSNVTNYGTLAFNRSDNIAFNKPIDGTGTLLKLGPGTLTLNAFNNYTGPTVINAGTLKLGADCWLPSSLIDIRSGVFDVSGFEDGTFTLDVGNTIKGNGAIAGAVDVLGTIAPGESAGTLTVGDMIFDEGSLLELELGGAMPGTQYDVLNSNGNITLLDNSTLKLSLVDNFAPSASEVFEILNFSSLSGTFSSLDLPQLDGSLSWDISNLYVNGALSVVPEPGIYVLLLMAFSIFFAGKFFANVYNQLAIIESQKKSPADGQRPSECPRIYSAGC